MALGRKKTEADPSFEDQRTLALPAYPGAIRDRSILRPGMVIRLIYVGLTKVDYLITSQVHQIRDEYGVSHAGITVRRLTALRRPGKKEESLTLIDLGIEPYADPSGRWWPKREYTTILRQPRP